MEPRAPLSERQEMRFLRKSASDYDCLGRREFALDHEGFFMLCMDGMRPRDNLILMHRWFTPWCTLEETGNRFGLCRERVRQIECKSFRIIFRAIYALWHSRDLYDWPRDGT